jgi:DNA mismatch repair protein MutS
LAGLPDTVTARARHVLAQLEENNAAGTSTQNGAANNLADALPLFEARLPQPPKSHALHDAVTGIDPDRLSPREALDWLYRLQEIADNKGDD